MARKKRAASRARPRPPRAARSPIRDWRCPDCGRTWVLKVQGGRVHEADGPKIGFPGEGTTARRVLGRALHTLRHGDLDVAPCARCSAKEGGILAHACVVCTPATFATRESAEAAAWLVDVWEPGLTSASQPDAFWQRESARRRRIDELAVGWRQALQALQAALQEVGGLSPCEVLAPLAPFPAPWERADSLTAGEVRQMRRGLDRLRQARQALAAVNPPPEPGRTRDPRRGVFIPGDVLPRLDALVWMVGGQGEGAPARRRGRLGTEELFVAAGRGRPPGHPAFLGDAAHALATGLMRVFPPHGDAKRYGSQAVPPLPALTFTATILNAIYHLTPRMTAASVKAAVIRRIERRPSP